LPPLPSCAQGELDYSLFWVTVYHSSIPYFKLLAGFLREQLGIHLWEVRRIYSSTSITHNSFTPEIPPSLPLLFDKQEELDYYLF
jgi:hypothetical protein